MIRIISLYLSLMIVAFHVFSVNSQRSVIRKDEIITSMVSRSIYFSSLQQLKDDIKAGRVPIHGVDIGGWLVAEHWMTSSSPAWNGVPDNIANEGEYQTMKYLGRNSTFISR